MFSAKVTLILSFLAFASASPLEARNAACSPNFGGPPGLSIVHNNREWSLASSPPGPGTAIIPRTLNINNNEFRVEFTGRPSNDYLIKPVGFPDLRVAANAGSNLGIVTPNSADLTQAWIIQCNICGVPTTGIFTTGCTIKSVANGQCVQIGPVSLSLAVCNGSPKQLFDFGASFNGFGVMSVANFFEKWLLYK